MQHQVLIKNFSLFYLKKTFSVRINNDLNTSQHLEVFLSVLQIEDCCVYYKSEMGVVYIWF